MMLFFVCGFSSLIMRCFACQSSRRSMLIAGCKAGCQPFWVLVGCQVWHYSWSCKPDLQPCVELEVGLRGSQGPPGSACSNSNLV
ncbi:hypothetical protein EI94DRAFT_1730795 [Lactarius quietus]|nr:hypothetical protein EI94DRAFT_1730795 [Lactarius quietus]